MHIVGVGIDIVEIERVQNVRNLARVAEFFFLSEELEDMKQSRDRVQFVASRLALKEAIIKSFPDSLYYHDIHIKREMAGVSAQFKRLSDQKYKVFLSVSHEFKYTVACATLCL